MKESTKQQKPLQLKLKQRIPLIWEIKIEKKERKKRKNFNCLIQVMVIDRKTIECFKYFI